MQWSLFYGNNIVRGRISEYFCPPQQKQDGAGIINSVSSSIYFPWISSVVTHNSLSMGFNPFWRNINFKKNKSMFEQKTEVWIQKTARPLVTGTLQAQTLDIGGFQMGSKTLEIRGFYTDFCQFCQNLLKFFGL